MISIKIVVMLQKSQSKLKHTQKNAKSLTSNILFVWLTNQQNVTDRKLFCTSFCTPN